PPEPLLVRERVNRAHDPVDLVVELDAALLPLGAGRGDAGDALEPLGVRVGPEAALAQPLQRLEVRVREAVAFAYAGSVDPDRQRPFRGDRRILLPERARRSVARIRGRALALFGLTLRERTESRERHVDLAAHLEQ